MIRTVTTDSPQMPSERLKSFLSGPGMRYLQSAGGYIGMKTVIFSLTGLVSQFILTRAMSREDYGLLIWAGAIIGMLGPFGLPGISTSIVGAVAKGYEGNFRKGTILELATGSLGGVLLLGITAWYAYFSAEPPKAGIFLVAAILSPGLWLDTHLCLWNGRKNFKAMFWWPVSVRIAQFAGTAVTLCFTRNPVIVFAVQNILFATANVATALWLMRPDAANRNVLSSFSEFGWFSTKLYWIGGIAAYWDKLVTGHLFGLEALALVAVGELIYSYFYKTPSAFLSQVFHPKLAKMETRDAAAWIRGKQPALIGGTLAVCLAIGLVAPFAYPLLFSQKYGDSVVYVNLYLICVVLGSPGFLSGTLLKAHALKHETRNGWLITVIGTFALVPLLGATLGIKGVIYAKAAVNAAVSGYYLILLRRLAK